MKLSVVIVNYNVKFFIEQCLISVQKAIQHIEAEVFVIDNNSVDGSVGLIKEKFPWVKLIANTENTGFSKANNQALKIAKGEYQLLLNPDTLVEEDTFSKIIQFMDNHLEAGGLGVKMIDGKGNFLPESKRGLPTPQVAFYKIFGLASLFPKSKKFGKYHLTYLDKEQIHEIEILSGAFMFMRKEALDKIGLLDEAFFMYGEDIDLSYRIILGGYKNYYFPKTSIIHYKGESTKKSSVNYVFVFYRAMIIFAKKHFSQQNAKLFSILINAAIYFRAFLAIANRAFFQWIIPLIDFALSFVLFNGISILYSRLTNKIFDETFQLLIIPIYIIIWQLTALFSGAYDFPIRIKKAIYSAFIGIVPVLIFYGLLSESLRFSRLLLPIFAIVLPLVFSLSRLLATGLFSSKIPLYKKRLKRLAIVGSETEVNRVSEILKESSLSTNFMGKVGPKNEQISGEGYLGNLEQLGEIITIFKLNEVIFCSKDVSSNDIIRVMSQYNLPDLEYKIAPEESVYVIGSNSINRSGEYYSILNVNRINSAENKRKKWLLDKSLSLILLITSPIFMWFFQHRWQYFKNVVDVFRGVKSFVGFHLGDKHLHSLPKIKSGILNAAAVYQAKNLSENQLHQLNLLYAKDYDQSKDFELILKCWKQLDGPKK